ncbi:hypothetical protein ACFQV4_28455 [Streptomyces thermocarboxydus]
MTRLERSGGRVTAVVAGDERILRRGRPHPDLPVAYGLLGGAPRRPARLRHSPSAVVLHLGTDRTWPELAHHLSFGEAWRGTFDELTRAGRLMSDPSLLVTRPTATDPSLAPPGRHLHYVLAPCPNTDIGPGAAAWTDLAPRYRDSVLRTLEERGLTGLASSIEAECVVTPADWAAQGHAAGTPFATAHTFAQTGPFRPRNLVRSAERGAGRAAPPRCRRADRAAVREAGRTAYHRCARPRRTRVHLVLRPGGPA